MASLSVTEEWSDPSASLTADQVYTVQNKSAAWVQFFEGAAFDAATNANDGVLLAPIAHTGGAPNHMRWTYDSGNQVRMRRSGALDDMARVEFALSA